MPYTPHPPRLHNSNYTWWSTNHAAPRYAVFSTLLSHNPSMVHIFSSTPCSQTPSVYYVRDHVSHPYRTTDKISLVYSNQLHNHIYRVSCKYLPLKVKAYKHM
jgi:hypothetical protein